MKKLLLSLFLLPVLNPAKAQMCTWYHTFTFEDTVCLNAFSYSPALPDNVWDIGKPQKTYFSTTTSPDSAMVTDLTNPYPVNDTSSFIVTMIDNGGFDWPHTVTISGMYYVDSDSLTDYGLIELSADHGQTWIDLINNTAYSQYISYSPAPVLTGNSFGWQPFNISPEQLGVPLDIHTGDTVLFRFSFISDSVQTNKDGLMYDDLHFENFIEAIEEYNGNMHSSVQPNPAEDHLTVKFDNAEKETMQVTVTDNLGRIVLQRATSDEQLSIDTHELSKGVYYYRVLSAKGDKYSAGKFMVK